MPSIQEALHGYTATGAWLTREETLKGSLEPTTLADFIVLDLNPLTLAPDDLRTLQVRETWLGGRQVYAAPAHQEDPI